MKFDDVREHDLTVKGLLHQVLKIVKRIENKQGESQVTMTQELQDLKDQVTESTAVEQSAIVLINGLGDKLDALADNPAAIRALSVSLKSSATDLAAAIVARTPAAPPPVDPPPTDQPPVDQPPTDQPPSDQPPDQPPPTDQPA